MSQHTTQTDGGTGFKQTIEAIATGRDDTEAVYINSEQDEGDTFADLNVDGNCVPAELLADLSAANIHIRNANEVLGSHLTCLTVGPHPKEQ